MLYFQAYLCDEEFQAVLCIGDIVLYFQSYLCDEEFQAVLGMKKEDFYSLPTWRQIKKKKQVGLF